MASTGKSVFNIDGLTIRSTLNIPIQRFLFSVPNLSTNSLNRLTCRYEQLQFVVIHEISLVGGIMFNIINNKLRSIKHIHNKIFSEI